MDIVAARERPTDPKLTRPLVSQQFALVSCNAVLEAVPQVVHFGGFQLHSGHTQKVRILNKSTRTTRLHLLVPTEPPFHVTYERKGNIFAGVSEELLVTFTPTEYKYYYDCIKVHSADGNFLIPLHGYPVVNKVAFPSSIHFGTQPLGRLSRRLLKLSCSVPMEFEFRIEVVVAHSSIVVEPLTGIIPANGSVTITVAFHPIVLANVFSEIVLHISQFNHTPQTCVISGSSAPGLTGPETDEPEESKVDAEVDQVVEQPVKPPQPSRPKAAPPVSKEEAGVTIVDGLKIPKDLNSVHATTFILTQQAGKFKPKDLKKAIDENRALRKRQKAEQEALRQKTGGAGGRLSLDVIVMEESATNKPTTRQLQELVFLQDLQEINKMEKDLEFQSNREYIGDDLLAPESIDAIRQIRAFNQAEKEEKERDALRRTFVSHGAAAHSTPATRAVLPAGYVPASTPDFNEYKNDLWAKRKRTLAHFIQVVSTCIVRQRVTKRLRKIKAWLGPASSRAEVRRMVERDWKLALMNVSSSTASSGRKLSSRTEGSEETTMSHQLSSFPVYMESDSRLRFPVATTIDTVFNDFDLYPLHVPHEADLTGYKPHPLLPIPQYVPLELSRKMRSGAHHEAGTRAPRATAPKDADAAPRAVANETLHWPLTVRKTLFCLPPASLRVYAPMGATPVETDPAYALRPRLRPRDVPQSVISALGLAAGTVSLGTRLPYFLHLAWHDTTDSEDGRGLWELPACAPQFALTATPAIEALSDSESDNEDETGIVVPTMEDAEKLFQDASSPALTSLSMFARYDAMLQLDQEYKTYRYDLCNQLPKRMADVAQHVKNKVAPFVLQGHGEVLPLHCVRLK
ncbi:hypothetical protein ACHHYP_07417 [Achlya hypogyna]|uniref:Uncharacterized protein n=1 Tax=Achlya hypogyna TaxID=1202772 RepID=A0A1V9ZLV2_ACHHY|nr:hypothetical protein ACHHYP_07417 [Achlya hypogyna]